MTVRICDDPALGKVEFDRADSVADASEYSRSRIRVGMGSEMGLPTTVRLSQPQLQNRNLLCGRHMTWLIAQPQRFPT